MFGEAQAKAQSLLDAHEQLRKRLEAKRKKGADGGAVPAGGGSSGSGSGSPPKHAAAPKSTVLGHCSAAPPPKGVAGGGTDGEPDASAGGASDVRAEARTLLKCGLVDQSAKPGASAVLKSLEGSGAPSRV